MEILIIPGKMGHEIYVEKEGERIVSISQNSGPKRAEMVKRRLKRTDRGSQTKKRQETVQNSK